MMLDAPTIGSDAFAERRKSAPGPLRAFLIPSVFGDEPQLQDLRRQLEGAIDFDVLALPDAGAPGTLLTDMAATGRLLVDEIRRRCPWGSVALVGYSFGASMALEVATQLAEMERHVAFLAVLDGPFEPPTVRTPRPADSLFATPRRLLKSVAVEATQSMDSVRRLVTKAPPGSDAGNRAEPMRRAMLWHLRNKALTRWTPRGCSAPGLHVSTGDYGSGNRSRWAELCPNLDHVEISAVHEDLLKGESLKAVSSSLEAAVHAHRA